MLVQLALSGVAAVTGVPAAFAAPPPKAVRLDARSALALATRLRDARRESAAIALYEELTRDPDVDIRTQARVGLAMIHVTHKRMAAAAFLLRRALDERPHAGELRVTLARLLDELGDEPAARRELRAARAGSLSPELAAFVDRYSVALRARKPTGASIEIALAPNSNINRATRSDTINTVIGDFDLDQDARPRSGVGVSLRGQAFARQALGDDLRLLGRVQASGDLYKQSRFNDLGVELAGGPEFSLGRNRFTVEAAAGRRWYGRDPLANHVRLGASVARAVGPVTQLRLAASRSWIDHRLNDLQDGTATAIQLSAERALSSRAGIVVTIAGERHKLGDAAYSTRSWRGAFLGWHEVGPATLTVAIDYGRLKADDRLALLPHARSDDYRRLATGLVMRRWSWRGFAPTVRWTREVNHSTIEFYDYRRTRTDVGIVRAF